MRTARRAAYPELDPHGALRSRIRAFMLAEGLHPAGDPFVPLLPSNRRPSPVFEVFVPVKTVS